MEKMAKEKLDVSPIGIISEVYQLNKTFKIRPYLTGGEQAEIINEYLNQYFYSPNHFVEDSEVDFIGAEFYLIMSVVDKVTNIEVLKDGISIEEIIASGLWEIIKRRITNYAEFRAMLDRVISDKKEQLALAKSVGATIDRVVEKVEETLLNLAQNVDPDKLKEVATGILRDMEQSPIAPAFKEAQQEKVEKARRTRKKKTAE
jgi:hypothetical protein